MKTPARKTIFLTLAALILCACLLLAADTLKAYSHTVPIVIGPYRQALFTLLIFLLAVSLRFAFRNIDPNTLTGTLCLALSVLWFTGESLLTYTNPHSPWLDRMAHSFPLPLILFGIGAALWIGSIPWTVPEAPQPLLVLLLIIIVLQPVLSGGFYWDDAFFSVEGQYMRLTGTSVFDRVWKEIADYVRIGRINPFAAFHFLVFYYLPHAPLYKLMLLLLTLLGGTLFCRFLHLWKGERQTALTSLLLTALCFQFRLYHDPLNSYYGLMQIMFIELMASLILYLRWLRDKKTPCLILSLLIFAMGLMSYEMFFPLTLLYLIPAYDKEKQIGKALRHTLPWLTLALLIFALSMTLRGNITEETAYNGTTFSLDIPLILRTFATQVGAAFPLSYRNAGYDTGVTGTLIPWHDIFSTSLPLFIRSVRWQDLIGILILILTLSPVTKDRPAFSLSALLFGLLLWLLPGLVISLSSKYQQDLLPGLAYIPVYFSYFGMGILLCETIAFSARILHPRTLPLILTGIGSMILLITQQDNRRISLMLDDMFLYPRAAGEEALQMGILGESDAETIISAVPYSLWEHGWLREPYQEKFYSLNARRPVHAVGEWDYTESFREEQTVWETPRNTILITYGGDARGGYAKCGLLNGTAFDFDTRTLRDPMVTEALIYVSGANRTNLTLLYETRDAEWKHLPLKDAWLVKESDKGVLYKIQEKRPILFDTISLSYSGG